jgi:hypothetical protein
MTPIPKAGPAWIAVCGPGRTLRTALILAVNGTTVTKITESAHLPDPDAIYLITRPPVFTLPPCDLS